MTTSLMWFPGISFMTNDQHMGNLNIDEFYFCIIYHNSNCVTIETLLHSMSMLCTSIFPLTYLGMPSSSSISGPPAPVTSTTTTNTGAPIVQPMIMLVEANIMWQQWISQNQPKTMIKYDRHQNYSNAHFNGHFRVECPVHSKRHLLLICKATLHPL